MVRALARVAMAFAVVAPVASSAEAGVKTEQKIQVQFGGLLGGIMNKFGGKAAKEGLVDTVAVVGDRKLTLNESTGQIVDLAEEKIYDLDVKKKTYTVTTFAELKKQIEEQRAKAEKEAAEARKEAAKKEGQEPAAAMEFEVDFEMKETGQKRTIAGHEARQVTMKAWVHEKGRQIQQSGGLLVTTDAWLAPKIVALEEIEDFDRRSRAEDGRALRLHCRLRRGLHPADDGDGRHVPGSREGHGEDEGRVGEGQPGGHVGGRHPHHHRLEECPSDGRGREAGRQPTGLGGLLAKKLMKQGNPSDPRSMLMTSTTELLKLTPDATAADVALPAGYKPK